MVTYKIYGSPQSVYTRLALLAFHEKDVPYTIVPTNPVDGDTKKGAYLEMNPWGRIPVMVEEQTGLTIYESRAIARYIATKYSSRGTPNLIPLSSDADLSALARFEQAASIGCGDFEAAVKPIYSELVEEFMTGKPRDQSKIDEGARALERTLDVYEKILSKSLYLAGDNVTLADLWHLPTSNILPRAGIHIFSDASAEGAGKWPNVARWWKALTERASWGAILEVSGEGVRKSNAAL